MKDAKRPHKIESSSPCDVLFCDEVDRVLGPSRIFPATAQSVTPNRTKAFAPRTAYPAALVRCSRCRETIGTRLPTAAQVPKTIEHASVISIMSTARPKKTCATHHAA